MGSACVTLGIVDRDPMALRLLRELLGRTAAPLHVLWAVAHGKEALERCGNAATAPQVALVDVASFGMNDMDGMGLIAQLRRCGRDIAIVAISASPLPMTQRQLQAAGIAVMLSKECSMRDIIRAVGGAAGNDACAQWCSREASLAPLTDSELLIIRLYAHGLTTRAIARQLERSESTIKTRMRTIYRKLGVSSRAEAVLRCAEDGLIP